MKIKKLFLISFIFLLFGILIFLFSQKFFPKKTQPLLLKDFSFPPLVFNSKPFQFTFEKEIYQKAQFSLPLKKLPQNYQKDLVEKLGISLSLLQKNLFLENGVLILKDQKFQKFENFYDFLLFEKVPLFVTSDSILFFLNSELKEIFKSLQMKKLFPMLKALLDALFEATQKQMKEPSLKEIAQRNLAFLAVAQKLLDPNFKIPFLVKNIVEKELERIKSQEGYFLSPLFSQDCPKECKKAFFSQGEKCPSQILDQKIPFEGKIWDSFEFYQKICSKKCYCEDFSQYKPKGYYFKSEKLKRYFQAITWLSRMDFKLRGDNWTKQAILLTLAAKEGRADFEGKKIPAFELWKKIYLVFGFFRGFSDDLNFYHFGKVLDEIFKKPIFLKEISQVDLNLFRKKILKLKGIETLSHFETDLAKNLKDLDEGMRLIGKKSPSIFLIFENLVYKKVGPNPDSLFYEKVLSCPALFSLSEKEDFYYSCQKMAQDKEKYWREVCQKAFEIYFYQYCQGLKLEDLYSLCRLFPSGLDLGFIFGSLKAEQILKDYYNLGYCGYQEQKTKLKKFVSDLKKGPKDIYHLWLWMLNPLLQEKKYNFPFWMRSDLWQLKSLITFLSSLVQLSSENFFFLEKEKEPKISKPFLLPPKFRGYVEPDVELWQRLKYGIDYLKEGLKEQGVLSFEISKSLQNLSQIFEKLSQISQKELKGIELSEKDYDFLDEIFSKLREKSLPSIFVTDFYFDSNTKRVLKGMTKKIDLLLIAQKNKEKKLFLAAGPIFSYYEFFWPTKKILKKDFLNKIPRPIWYRETLIESSQKPYLIF